MKDTYELLKVLGGKGGDSAPECFGKNFREVAHQLYEINAIVNTLAKAGRPMRVKEICKEIPSFRGPWYNPSEDSVDGLYISLCVHRLRLMRRAGLVVRTEAEGEPIEVENAWYFGGPEDPGTHTVTPKIAFYSLPSLD